MIGFGNSSNFAGIFTKAQSIVQISVDAQYIESKTLDCYDGKQCIGLANGQRADVLYTAPTNFVSDVIYTIQQNFSDFSYILHSVYRIKVDTTKKSIVPPVPFQFSLPHISLKDVVIDVKEPRKNYFLNIILIKLIWLILKKN